MKLLQNKTDKRVNVDMLFAVKETRLKKTVVLSVGRSVRKED